MQASQNAASRIEQLRDRRIIYTDAQRRRLATAAKKLGRKALSELDTLVTPDTLRRWYRRLVAKKYDGTNSRGTRRPRRTPDVVALVLRMAKDNSTWGYTRIRGVVQSRPRARPQHDQTHLARGWNRAHTRAK